ncbi:hypothetical protein ABPG72_011862 [Tetrahymena utriculariae]
MIQPIFPFTMYMIVGIKSIGKQNTQILGLLYSINKRSKIICTNCLGKVVQSRYICRLKGDSLRYYKSSQQDFNEINDYVLQNNNFSRTIFNPMIILILKLLRINPSQLLKSRWIIISAGIREKNFFVNNNLFLKIYDQNLIKVLINTILVSQGIQSIQSNQLSGRYLIHKIIQGVNIFEPYLMRIDSNFLGNANFQYTFCVSNQFLLTSLKTQIQETQVKQGLIIQEQQTFSSPIYYDQTTFSFNRNYSLQQGIGPYNQINIQMDEYVQFVCIQYSTITQILALVNSVATIMTVCRILGIYVSQKLIKQDFFILMMRNLFLEKCEQILQHNTQITQSCQLYLQSQKKEGEEKEDSEADAEVEKLADNISEYQNKKDKTLPDFQSKFLQKRYNSKLFFDESSCSSIQKQKFDDEYQFKDEIKMTSSFVSPKNQNYFSSNMANYSKIDKSDSISQNEFHMFKQINSGIFDKQKQLFATQYNFLQKQIDSQKNNLKADLK